MNPTRNAKSNSKSKRPARARKARSRPIDLLFPKGRRDILAATLLHPDKWWYLSDLARAIDAVPQALRRDLNQLVAAGILEKRADGNRVYFKPDPACPILHELQSIFLKTAGLLDVLRDALKPQAKKIQFAFVYGSIARGEELSESDVDLMVIGNARLSGLASPLKQAEESLSRAVNPTVYTPREYTRKLQADHNFVTRVHHSSKLFVIGNEHDLEQLAQAASGAAT